MLNFNVGHSFCTCWKDYIQRHIDPENGLYQLPEQTNPRKRLMSTSTLPSLLPATKSAKVRKQKPGDKEIAEHFLGE